MVVNQQLWEDVSIRAKLSEWKQAKTLSGSEVIHFDMLLLSCIDKWQNWVAGRLHWVLHWLVLTERPFRRKHCSDSLRWSTVADVSIDSSPQCLVEWMNTVSASAAARSNVLRAGSLRQSNPLAKTGVPDASAVMIHTERGAGGGRRCVLKVTRHWHCPCGDNSYLLCLQFCMVYSRARQRCNCAYSIVNSWTLITSRGLICRSCPCCLFWCVKGPVWHYHILQCVNEITHRRAEFREGSIKNVLLGSG